MYHVQWVICATTNQKDISNLSNFGMNSRESFQITDDLIGVMGDFKITKTCYV
jgi:geranylgeranyl diphosphate synthase type I